MSNMFKHVRIVHSPKERRYTVEERGIFSWRWSRVEAYGYVEMHHTNLHSPVDLATDAMARAVEKAETLLARTVVWEGSNFTWGP